MLKNGRDISIERQIFYLFESEKNRIQKKYVCNPRSLQRNITKAEFRVHIPSCSLSKQLFLCCKFQCKQQHLPCSRDHIPWHQDCKSKEHRVHIVQHNRNRQDLLCQGGSGYKVMRQKLEIHICPGSKSTSMMKSLDD